MAKDKLLRDFHEALGEYVFTFETMMHVIKVSIKVLFRQGGLKDMTRYDILIHEMFANQLLTSFKGLVNQTRPKEIEDKAVKEYMNTLYNLIKDNMERRNEFLHSTYGLAVYPDESNQTVVRLMATKHKLSKGKFTNKFQDKINEDLIKEIRKETMKNIRATNKMFVVEHILTAEMPLKDIIKWDKSSLQ
jgi:hypothetical protein